MINASKNIKDLNIQKVELINYMGETIDISALFLQINIYESIFSNFMTGDIIINDGLDLLNNFPIICQEKIRLQFYNPGFQTSKVLEFNVVRVSDIKTEINNDKVQTYILHFTTVEALKNRLVTVSRLLKGKADDVVYKLLTEDWGLKLKEHYKIEKSDTEVKFVVPYWDPVQTINYLATRCIPEGAKYPTYLFYQDWDNLNFVSFESMLANPVTETFYYAPPNAIINYGIDERAMNVNRYEISHYVDLFDMLDNNVAFNDYLEVDLLNKKYKTNKYDYLEHSKKIPSLYHNPLIPESNLDGLEFNKSNNDVRTVYNFSDDKDMKKFNKWILYRQPLLKLMQSIIVKIETTENVERRVGNVVEFNIPSRERFENGMKYAKLLSGKFVISKIRHSIGHNSLGTTTIELIKDSFPKPLDGGKV